MGIQFKQVDGLDSTFNALSGDLQGQITSGSSTGIASGEFSFSGDKTFIGNVTASGAQGLGVYRDSFYNQGYAFIVSGLQIGAVISTPRNNTAAPAGKFQVTGGSSYFDGAIYSREGGFSGTLVTGVTVTGVIVEGQTGDFGVTTGARAYAKTGRFNRAYVGTGELGSLNVTQNTATAASISGHLNLGSGTVTGGLSVSGVTTLTTGSGQVFTGSEARITSGDFKQVTIIGHGSEPYATGILRLQGIPDWDTTGSLSAPQSGTVYRSGNYLMIV